MVDNKIFCFLNIQEVSDSFLKDLQEMPSINSSFSSFGSGFGLQQSKNFEEYFNKEQKQKIQSLLKNNLSSKGYNVNQDKYKSKFLHKLIFWLYSLKIKLFFSFKRNGYFWLYCKFKK